MSDGFESIRFNALSLLFELSSTSKHQHTWWHRCFFSLRSSNPSLSEPEHLRCWVICFASPIAISPMKLCVTESLWVFSLWKFRHGCLLEYYWIAANSPSSAKVYRCFSWIRAGCGLLLSLAQRSYHHRWLQKEFGHNLSENSALQLFFGLDYYCFWRRCFAAPGQMNFIVASRSNIAEPGELLHLGCTSKFCSSFFSSWRSSSWTALCLRASAQQLWYRS